MLARLIGFVLRKAATAVLPVGPDCESEAEARLAKIEAETRDTLVNVRRSIVSAECRLDQIAARLRDTSETRDVLMKALAGGVASVPRECRDVLPGAAGEYFALLNAAHEFTDCIRQLRTTAEGLETSASAG